MPDPLDKPSRILVAVVIALGAVILAGTALLIVALADLAFEVMAAGAAPAQAPPPRG